jgi:hypothetical protein
MLDETMYYNHRAGGFSVWNPALLVELQTIGIGEKVFRIVHCPKVHFPTI